MFTLRKLVSSDEAAFVKAVAAFHATREFTLAPGYDPETGFAAYLEQMEAVERGERLPEGHVPSTMLFGFSGEDCVGRVMIRHRLNDFLLKVGGHIGYGVAPDFREKGYAKAMLKMALPVARRLGIERVLVTCNEDNVGSIKTIEANAGVLENTVDMGEGRARKRRYWIDLA